MTDVRGLACPMPVVMVRREMEKNSPASMEVLLDNQTAVENVSRFAGSNGYQVEVRPAEDDEFTLVLTKQG